MKQGMTLFLIHGKHRLSPLEGTCGGDLVTGLCVQEGRRERKGEERKGIGGREGEKERGRGGKSLKCLEGDTVVTTSSHVVGCCIAIKTG